MCCFCIDDGPIEGDKYAQSPSKTQTFQISMGDAPCASPGCFLVSFFLPPCALFALRKKALGGSLEDNICCMVTFNMIVCIGPLYHLLGLSFLIQSNFCSFSPWSSLNSRVIIQNADLFIQAIVVRGRILPCACWLKCYVVAVVPSVRLGWWWWIDTSCIQTHAIEGSLESITLYSCYHASASSHRLWVKLYISLHLLVSYQPFFFSSVHPATATFCSAYQPSRWSNLHAYLGYVILLSCVLVLINSLLFLQLVWAPKWTMRWIISKISLAHLPSSQRSLSGKMLLLWQCNPLKNVL